ncbi:PhnA domain-containing protein [Croceivirga sp. JEA036]|uniref:PhnA domain-containing protein n=1 Tax=Croceivirga sp. JEA036 TaxID=2721162 RepID=UPI00143B43BD|nr:alkylphosphonate utilization protein [Croceivirga sp. JEA036]NJB36501.1 PhnA protein [Croceivirga sp. JEA036]
MIKELQERSGNQCELCGSQDNLEPYIVAPKTGSLAEECALLCAVCSKQLDQPETADPNHWRLLNDSIWNPNAAVQVLSFRMLHHLKHEGWPVDLLDMMYLEDDTRSWAEATLPNENALVHKDSNGNILAVGDNVVLIQDLNVKGAGFTAKRGTAVRNISLDHENETYIEGKVNGQHIVILTKYVKKL